MALAEFGDRRVQVLLGEIGPEGVDEDELGVGAFPEHEVAETPLTAAPDQEIDLTGAVDRMGFRGNGRFEAGA